jgi:hypothetical protein
MNLVKIATDAVERVSMPDAVARFGISMLVGRTGRRLAVAAGEGNTSSPAP